MVVVEAGEDADHVGDGVYGASERVDDVLRRRDPLLLSVLRRRRRHPRLLRATGTRLATSGAANAGSGVGAWSVCYRGKKTGKEEEDDRRDPHGSHMDEEEDRGVLLSIRKYVGLHMGPTASKAYIMVYFRVVKNYNGSSQNR